MNQLACGLSQPWEITWGPDNHLWVTEAESYQIDRIEPTTGTVKMLIDLSDKKDFPDTLSPFPQGGLMGLAIHPEIFSGKPYVYIAYVHHFDGCLAGMQGCFFKSKIVRYTYNSTTESLSDEMVLVDTLPGSNDHNGGRLAIGPAGEGQTGMYLFYSIGDMGAGHLRNQDRPNHAQNINKYEGKILRFNLEPDGDANAFDSWIPNDNPFNNLGKQNAVWTFGHRNPQGLVFSPSGTLYEAEHGPYSDDEINIIQPGVNYGHPLISGFADGNYDGSAVGAGTGVPLIASEMANMQAIQSAYIYKDPIFSLFPAPQAMVSEIWNNDNNDTPPYDNYFLQWPTAAPSGIHFYNETGIPGWQSSILVATLKLGRMFRLKLSNDGQSVVGDTIPYFEDFGRVRDIATNPDGTQIFISLDSSGQLKGAPGTFIDPPIKGCILQFTFQSTGVAETYPEDAIRVFPNPADQALTVDFSALQNGIERVVLFDVLGTQLFEKQLERSPETSLELDLSNLPDGNYLLAVQPADSQQRIMKKVTVLRRN